ncbi:AAC(3) family N-acetyltransferase [Candidatus Woesearchaeota archaeon]|nr:AAC(3) family N-acetyltransferase [Candidatus Woesearchaeota archaeon]
MHNKAIFSYNGKKYSSIDILKSLREVGIKEGDSIFVHSQLKYFGKIISDTPRNKFIGSFIDSLKASVGREGNLIMPAFSYTFCKKEDFYPDTTPSTVGVITENFRKADNVKRSIDPIFSVAALGPKSGYFTDVGTNCFGKNSIFEKLYQNNVKMVFLGERFDITFMHFVEQKLDVCYRFIKKFKGKIKIGNQMKEFEFYYNVRPLDKSIEYDLDKIARYFMSCGILQEARLGNSKIRCVGSVDAFASLTQAIRKDIHFLLK